MKKYQRLSFLSGLMLSVMVMMNGVLSNHYGVYHSSLYIHIVGTAFAGAIVCIVNKQLHWVSCIRPWMFMGGVIGVSTTVFNNLAYGHISITGIVALCLFGQLITAAFIDGFGMFGMRRFGFRSEQLPGIALSLLGIIRMLAGTNMENVLPVLLSICAGISIVLSRTVNARTSDRIGALNGSLINHIAGIPVCIILTIATHEIRVSSFLPLWAWGGGMIGVLVVLICNIVVPKIPAKHLTMLTFCGQVLGGILLDLSSGNAINEQEFSGGILVAFGILFDNLYNNSRIKDTNISYQNRLIAKSIDHKLVQLSRVAERFNKNHIRWAVGGSMLLHLSGCKCYVHDIDILIDENDSDKVKEIMGNMGQIQEFVSSEQYASHVFLECVIDSVDFDIIGGFTIKNGDAMHYFPLKDEEITTHITVKGQDIPLHSIDAWREYYRLIHRDDKVALIDSFDSI